VEPVSDWDSPEEILSRANDDVDRVAPLTYRDALRTVIKQRDDLQAKLDAELPAAWREDLASLNECLDRAWRERDGLREENARLNTLLLSATGENQKRAEREARALEDWRDLRAENDRLKASRLPDVEYARLDTMWQQLVRERDEFKARLMHAEADAEQAIYNEAFAERQKIVAYIHARLAHATLDDRVSMRERGVMIDLGNAIERGEHREDGMIHERRP